MPIHHLGFKVKNYPETRDFYLAALKPLGYGIVASLMDRKVLGLGVGYQPDFWLVSLDVQSLPQKEEDTVNNAEGIAKYDTSRPVHIAFAASNREQVRQVYKAAIAAGGKCNGPPGVRKNTWQPITVPLYTTLKAETTRLAA
ncbi:hypothetical protein B0H34DRAFT_800733 [Crassisporium funariophilum]|nr:hypothetical protein B0H34DRAFT_800733 [Crassisporium funariophilum]